jgi:PadR family transcriptional regulator PadR
MGSDQLRGHLDALLLAVLEDDPAHGYRIIEQLRGRSDDVLDVPEGTVYPALHRLESRGLVASSLDIVDGRERRVYRLTRRGRRFLAEGRHEWGRFAGAVSAILGVSTA